MPEILEYVREKLDWVAGRILELLTGLTGYKLGEVESTGSGRSQSRWRSSGSRAFRLPGLPATDTKPTSAGPGLGNRDRRHDRSRKASRARPEADDFRLKSGKRDDR